MNLAQQIQRSRLDKVPFDAEAIENAVREWFSTHSNNKVWFHIRCADISKGYDSQKMSIPQHWERHLWEWGKENGFQVSECRGEIALEL